MKTKYKVTRIYPNAQVADYTIFDSYKEAELYARSQKNYGYFFIKIEACNS